MLGTKLRSFAQLPQGLSLEDLVPEDHFYRRLEARLDLSFVRELVKPLYANGGRPSVDPVVYFKLEPEPPPGADRGLELKARRKYREGKLNLERDQDRES